MFELNLEIEGGINKVSSGYSQINKYTKIHDEFWNKPIDRLKKIMDDRASHIVRFGVAKSTKQWRRKAYMADKTVEAHLGEEAPVLNSPRVGRRTGTFIKDLRYSKEPGIHISFSKASVRYEVIPETFAEVHGGRFKGKGYPLIFNEYLKMRGIVPEEGMISVEGEEEEYLFKSLEEEAIILFSKEFKKGRGQGRRG